MLDFGSGEPLPAALTLEAVHAAVASERYHVLGAPSTKMLTRISGTGLAPWEIHRPQKFVRDLVLRGCFSGRVLDAGCGIGDNALFIAKACPQAHVTAVDVSPRCVAFATAKAGLRRMTSGLITLEKFVRDLVLRGCFSGRVLDAGCGIGDNALFIAKACPQAHVTAVDVSPRCVAFATAKAGLRRMTSGLITLETASLTEPEPERQAACVSSPASDGTFDVVLDSSTFHCFCDADRELYAASLRRLLRPGGKLFVNCMSEAETRPGGPRRVSVAELLSMFNRQSGWEVEVIEDSVIELHPTFWGGQTVSRLYTVRKL
ncbi:hypothetical protein CHLRE_02g095090v5 [Chlamydomonas reinhardtii]|uniref:Methyltransferase domain-containing protein n=1 Tax=Chlamydomonas reinhardtii TaxID=3055 RepID=A0A2K3E1P6_CHLRE|nr:uncharacterized protein CHLRE_02g095090v5 [Chlamydomonas reinhardtii]PNW86704.1 hypothetical protein CHLRE_02g095090v5 [Chlamydomonas reinhardtii]